MNVLPEILDSILSLLESDKAALRACCESHPMLSQLAEPYLYSNIRLEWIDGDDIPGLSEPEFRSPLDLYNHLDEKPHVIGYIRGLEILFSIKSRAHMNDLLGQTSAILSMLSSLRTITFDLFPPYDYPWKSLPESFRQAFLKCLDSPSMQDLSITHFVDFPFIQVLSGAYKTITRLAVSKALKSQTTSNCINLDDTPCPNKRHTFGSLSINNCDNLFLSMLIIQIKQQDLQFRSLEFTPFDFQSFHTFSSLLARSSKSLIKLDLAIDIINPHMYGYMILVTLSTLPQLERFIIRAKLEYISQSGQVLSPISHLKQLFTTNFSSDQPTSSLKHVTLDFKCIMHKGQIPSFSFSKDFSSPLIDLLSSISTFAKSTLSTLIRVDLCLRGSDRHEPQPHDTPSDADLKTVPMPLHFLLSPLYQCGELKEFISRGMLSVKPMYS